MFLKITVKILIRLKYYADTRARCLLTQAIHALFRNDSFSILLEQQPYTLDSIFLHYTIHISKSIALNASSDFYLHNLHLPRSGRFLAIHFSRKHRISISYTVYRASFS